MYRPRAPTFSFAQVLFGPWRFKRQYDYHYYTLNPLFKFKQCRPSFTALVHPPIRPSSTSRELGRGVSDVNTTSTPTISTHSSSSKCGISHSLPSRSHLRIRPSPASQDLGCGVSNVNTTAIINIPTRSFSREASIGCPPRPSHKSAQSPLTKDLGCGARRVDTIIILNV
jgi:hypothetical protein